MATIYKEKQDGDFLGKSRAMRGRIDEAIAKEMQELGKASILGVILSAGGFVILGVLLYLVALGLLVRTKIFNIVTVTLGQFFFIYTISVAVLMFIGMKYIPKESYYLGLTARGRLYDNPLTLQDNLDRSHAAMGILIAVPNFIRMNAMSLYDYVKAKKPLKNSTLAAAILILCQEGLKPEILQDTLQPTGFGKTAIEEAVNFMHRVEWVETGTDKETGAPLLVLTEKGKTVLKDAEQFV